MKVCLDYASYSCQSESFLSTFSSSHVSRASSHSNDVKRCNFTNFKRSGGSATHFSNFQNCQSAQAESEVTIRVVYACMILIALRNVHVCD